MRPLLRWCADDPRDPPHQPRPRDPARGTDGQHHPHPGLPQRRLPRARGQPARDPRRVRAPARPDPHRSRGRRPLRGDARVTEVAARLPRGRAVRIGDRVLLPRLRCDGPRAHGERRPVRILRSLLRGPAAAAHRRRAATRRCGDDDDRSGGAGGRMGGTRGHQGRGLRHRAVDRPHPRAGAVTVLRPQHPLLARSRRDPRLLRGTARRSGPAAHQPADRRPQSPGVDVQARDGGCGTLLGSLHHGLRPPRAGGVRPPAIGAHPAQLDRRGVRARRGDHARAGPGCLVQYGVRVARQ